MLLSLRGPPPVLAVFLLFAWRLSINQMYVCVFAMANLENFDETNEWEV